MTHTSLIRANDGLTLKPGPVETLRFKMTHEDTDGAFDYLIGEIGYAGGPPMHIHIGTFWPGPLRGVIVLSQDIGSRS